MTTSTEITSHWLPEAVADIDRLLASSSPALRGLLDPHVARLARMNGGTSLGDALQRPASTPFVPLLDACAADLDLRGDARVGLLGRATVLLYAYVRLQDDLVDEPDHVQRAAVYAAEALLSEHLALFAAAIPDTRAFVLRSDIMRRFADVAAIEMEDRDRGPGEGASTAWMGAKFLPMAVPMAGLAVLAGRAALADVLVTFVQEVGTSLQLLNDVSNVAEDAAQGRPTPVLRWLGVRAKEVGEAPLRAVLLGHAALDRALDEAQRRAASASELARAHALPQTAAVADRVRDMVAAAPGRLLRLLLGAPPT